MRAPLINRNEKRLFVFGLIVSILAWIAITAVTFGTALIVLAFIWLLTLFLRGALISWLKGNAVKVTKDQLPDIHQYVKQCEATLDVKKLPEVYILNGNGVFNAFATHFLTGSYVVLMSSIVDSLESRPAALQFYIGHELGHLKNRHIFKRLLILPSLILPLFGKAYSRACEYTCDLHGLACSPTIEDAQYALAALASGSSSWKRMNIPAFHQQVNASSGFWMSLNEYFSTHPWLCKRAAYLEFAANNKKPKKTIGMYQIKFEYPKIIGDEIIRPSIAFLESVRNIKITNNVLIINNVIFCINFLFGLVSSERQKGQTIAIHNPA